MVSIWNLWPLAKTRKKKQRVWLVSIPKNEQINQEVDR